MKVRKTQGTGALVVGYHVPFDLRGFWPGAAIVEYGAAPSGGAHPTYQDAPLIPALLAELGLDSDVPVIGVAYSAGGRGVRDRLGSFTAVIVADGTYSTDPPAVAHVDAWQDLLTDAALSQRFVRISCTRIGAPGVASPAEVMAQAIGIPTPDGGQPEVIFNEGDGAVIYYPGTKTIDHREQGVDVLPSLVAEAAAWHGYEFTKATPVDGGGRRPAAGGAEEVASDGGLALVGAAVMISIGVAAVWAWR